MTKRNNEWYKAKAEFLKKLDYFPDGLPNGPDDQHLCWNKENIIQE